MINRHLNELCWNFSDVQKFCTAIGSELEQEGHKYFSEECIHDVEVQINAEETGGLNFQVSAKCYRSLHKNETPHSVLVILCTKHMESTVIKTLCSCAIGSSGKCGHVLGLLFQLAEDKALNCASVHDTFECTSRLQQWHVPRGENFGPMCDDDVELSVSSDDNESQPAFSNLYNPISGFRMLDFEELRASFAEIGYECQWPEFDSTCSEKVLTRFGYVPKGSVLSYQQRIDPAYITRTEMIQPHNKDQ